jgi:hypothetical protein
MRLAALPTLDTRPPAGPVYRSIFAVDLEGSTRRTNPVKGELRRVLYQLTDRALAATGITGQHLDQPTDRGDGMLILIRPHDNVPKTALLGQLIPTLTALLVEHNAKVSDPALRMRLRAVLHAGDVHADAWGFYGEELDVAFRLLDSPAVKKALRERRSSPLVLVTSEEIFRTIIRHGYLSQGCYEPLVRVRVANQQHRGWVHTPLPVPCEQALITSLPLALTASPAGEPARETWHREPGHAMKARFQIVRTP